MSTAGVSGSTAALRGRASSPPLPAPSRRPVAWTAVGAGVTLAGVGAALELDVVLVIGLALALLLIGVLAPESALALLLVAGAIKSAPFLAGVPGDLTLIAAGAVVVAIVSKAALSGVRPPPPAAFLALALAALFTLGLLWTPDLEAGLEKVLRFLGLTLLAFLAPLFLIDSRLALRRLVVALTALCLLVSLTAVPTEDVAQPVRAAGEGNEIQLGLFSAIGLIATLVFLRVEGGRARYLWLAAAPVFAFYVVAAGSRAALVGAVLALAFFAGTLVVSRPTVGRILFGVLLAGGVAWLVSSPGAIGLAGEKYAEQLFSTTPSSVVGGRGYLLERGLELSLANPVGLGPGGYSVELGPVERVIHPHNLLLELGSEFGVVAIGLFLALVVAAWRALSRAPGGRLGPEALLVGALLVLVLVEASVSLELNQGRELWFSLGLALALPALRLTGPPRVAGQT